MKRSEIREQMLQVVADRDAALARAARAEHKLRDQNRKHCILCGLPTGGKPYCYAHRGLG